MNFKNAVIYWIHLPEHTDAMTEGYLGVTKDFELRMKNHITDIQRNSHKNTHLVNAVKKYGWDNLQKDIILSGDEAYCYEIEEEMRPKKTIGWNIAPGGHRGPGWTKGRKKTLESIEKHKQSLAPYYETKRKEKFLRRERRLREREEKRQIKLKQLEDKKILRKARQLEKEKEKQRIFEERERRKQKRIKEGTYGLVTNYLNRPICKQCNKNHCAINYTRAGVTHYRSICDECGRKKIKKKPRTPNWQKSGYKKKSVCDLCGFKGIYQSQLLVFHIDGNLTNIALSNLRTICLNCVEVVKKKEVTWKRGDLQVDY